MKKMQRVALITGLTHEQIEALRKDENSELPENFKNNIEAEHLVLTNPQNPGHEDLDW